MSYAQEAFKYPTKLPPFGNPAPPAGGGGDVVYDECAQGIFQGFSGISVDPGSVGGYIQADVQCNATIPGSHVCTAADIIHTTRCMPNNVKNQIGAAWINNGPPSSTLSTTNDCWGWTLQKSSSGGVIYGTTWSFNSTGGKGGVMSCAIITKQFACCK